MAKNYEVKVDLVPYDPAGWDYNKDRLKPDSRIFIVGNDAGGVGKSLIAHFAAILLHRAIKEFLLIECETQPRLSKLFPEFARYHEYDPGNQEHDPDAAGIYWDAFARQITRISLSVVDFSANAVKNFIRWADTGSGEVYLRDGAGLIFICVTTAEEKSINAAEPNLTKFKTAFPAARLVLLLNPMHGVLQPTDNNIQLIHALTGAEVYSLPKMVAPAWDRMRHLGRFDKLAEMSNADLIRRGIDPGKAARSTKAFSIFAVAVSDVIQAIVARSDQTKRAAE